MTNKQTAKEKIESLVIRFEEQFESYKNSDYNETLTRRDFIDPFFKALGWDIDNESGYAEAYREVIHEDKVKVSGSTKAPDYSFRLVGGKRLFFVEAKKPSISVKEDIQPAYQVRRYGWSAKLPISIITDFEEFSIYDCTKKPKPNDKPPVARIKYLSFRDYIKEFDFLWDTFSKEQVLKGSFDKYLQSDTHKKGTATVDKDFLESLDRWRTYLAVSISWNNKTLDEEEINFVVQQTIDRIIFLRIAEDRGVEPYGTLHHATKLGNLYQNLFELFQKADQKYNSGLFDFKKDKISQDVIIDNKVIKTILNELYYPECPYEFSVLSVEILGSAYEQFLGKVIRITPAHHAKIEEKPEVRKAGGVYYTPQYIVDYIVKKTVGKLIEGKTPKEISKIKILDPACGSGSFLIGAFQYLLDYHKDYYSENGKPSKGKKDNPLTPDGHLTTAEKKRILLNNIYGVDLDANAVEVTKLSLLIKCLEGETEASINQQFKLFNERVLPTLEGNIKNGNSLVQNSFLDGELDFNFEKGLKNLKPFDWENIFSEIFRQGGFDAIIGNPPYSAKQSSDNAYLAKYYHTVEYKCDLFAFFVERGIQLLNKNGILGYIIPVSWMTNFYYKKLRSYLFESLLIEEINLINGLVFERANIDTNIIILSKANSMPTIRWAVSSAGDLNFQTTERPYSQFKADEGYAIGSVTDETWFSLKDKIEKQSIQLKEISKISLGMKLRSNDEFIVFEKSNENPDPIVFGKDIAKFAPVNPIRFFNFSKAIIVGGTKNQIIQRAKPKLFIQAIRNLSLNERIIATLDEIGLCFIGTVNSVVLTDNSFNIKYILGLLNSNLLNVYFKKRFTTISLTAAFLGVLPINKIETESKKKISLEIVDCVNQMIDLKADRLATTLHSKIEIIENRFGFLNSKLNHLVYDLYDLSQKEIELIEQN